MGDRRRSQRSFCRAVQFDRGVPAIRDRVVQGALKLILEPVFEAEFPIGIVWISAHADSTWKGELKKVFRRQRSQPIEKVRDLINPCSRVVELLRVRALR
jgi:hypothetical protein